MSNVCQLLQRQVAEHPHAPAITQRRRERNITIRYAELQQRVDARAGEYAELGLLPGNRVMILCPVSIELYIAVLALLRLGVTAMFVDPGAGLRRLDACCAAARPQAVIASPSAWLLRPLVRSLRWETRWISSSRRAGGRASPAEPAGVGTDHPALLTFTSGSTGKPRGVVRTHGFLGRQQQAIARELQLVAGQCELLTMPMFVLANLAAGVHSVLGDIRFGSPSKQAPRRLIQQLTSMKPDRMLASPSLLDGVADHCIKHSLTLDSLKRVTTGGAPVFPRTIDKLRQAMPSARLEVVYGSTEAEPIAVLEATTNDTEIRERIRLGAGLPAGKTASDLDVRLLSANYPSAAESISANAFESHCLSGQSIGEIVVHGERVIRSYLEGIGDEQTKIRVDADIWHRTGDLGRFDANGQLWLLGRVAGRVQDARGTLEPLSVEAAAMEHAAVSRCALMSLDGRRVLVVVPHRQSARHWRESIMDHLSWAQLDGVKAVPRLPLDRRHHAKIDYPALQRLFGTDAPGATSTT